MCYFLCSLWKHFCLLCWITLNKVVSFKLYILIFWNKVYSLFIPFSPKVYLEVNACIVNLCFLKFCCLPTILFYSCNQFLKYRIILLLTIEVLGFYHPNISPDGQCSHYPAVLTVMSYVFKSLLCFGCIYIDNIFTVILFPKESHWLLVGYGRHILNEATKLVEHFIKCLEILSGIFEPWTWNWNSCHEMHVS